MERSCRWAWHSRIASPSAFDPVPNHLGQKVLSTKGLEKRVHWRMARVVLAGYLLRVKGCGFRSVRYLESQNNGKGPVRSKRSSVIGNWEVVRSSEVCNALNLMPNSIGATGFVRYIEAVRSWEGPLWEVLLYYYTVIVDGGTSCSVY